MNEHDVSTGAGSTTPNETLLQKVDAVMVRVPDLDQGLAFYGDKLGHKLRWRSETAAGLSMGTEGTELVLSTSMGPETDLLVHSAADAVVRFVAAGGTIVSEPDDIPVGKVAVVKDPFGNQLILLDLSKGRYQADESGNVTGVHK